MTLFRWGSGCDDYVMGQRLRLEARFTVNKILTDPTDIFFYVFAPTDLVTTIFQYGVDAELVRAGVGEYYVDIDLDEKGTWEWRYASTGAVVAAGQGKFRVAAAAPI